MSSDVINNPLNRAVNDQRLQSMTREQPLPAWIEYAEDRSRNRSTLFMRVPVTRQSLMSGARVAVAAWVTERVMRPVVRDCLGETLTFASCMVADQSASTDDRLLVEGVPWKLHWYVRNHWHERISVAAATGCIAPDFVTCRLIHEPYRHGAAQATGSGNDDTRLSFIWQSLSR
ncbi:MAG: hypothetical protein HKN42_07295 [Granulosicoccus sp.]|nr:hypothetical protein [Granulosicoccus sp.]